MIKVFNSPFKITQKFGARPEYYGQFGLTGHEGLDLVPTSADWSVHSLPYKGVVVKDIDMKEKGGAYGITCTVWYPEINEAWQYCHLSSNTVYLNQEIDPSYYLGQMGATGNTSGAHLHVNRFKVNSAGIRQNKDNGYLGGIDPQPFLEDSAIIAQPIAQDHEKCKKDLQKANDRIQELDGIVDKDTHEISRLNQENEALKWQLKSIDDYSVSELLGALVRKLGGNAKPKEQS